MAFLWQTKSSSHLKKKEYANTYKKGRREIKM